MVGASASFSGRGRSRQNVSPGRIAFSCFERRARGAPRRTSGSRPQVEARRPQYPGRYACPATNGALAAAGDAEQSALTSHRTHSDNDSLHCLLDTQVRRVKAVRVR